MRLFATLSQAGFLATGWVLTSSLVWTIYSVDMGNRESANPELLPGTLYLLILRTLRSGPLHGYAIAKRIKEASEQGLDIEDGSLYPSLNRMLVKGWLAAEWGISENNRKSPLLQANSGRT